MTLTGIQTAPRGIPVTGSVILGTAPALVGARVLYTSIDPSHGEENDPVGVW